MIVFMLSYSTEEFVGDPKIKVLQVFGDELGSETSASRHLFLEIREALAVFPILKSLALGVESADSAVKNRNIVRSV